MFPRAVKATEENSKQRTHCVTSEFQLGFSQVELWFIYRYKSDCDMWLYDPWNNNIIISTKGELA
jgi:hypothetical protein